MVRQEEVLAMPFPVRCRMASIPFLVLFSALLLPALAAAEVISIDFERFPGPDGVFGTVDDVPAPDCLPGGFCGQLGGEFASLGMLVTSGTLEEGGLFPGTAPTNHYITSSPLDATLSLPVTGISVTSFSLWTATLYALDENNNVIASNTLTHPNPGSLFLQGTLSVTASQPIHRFTVLPAGCAIGQPCNPILNLDNLVLVTAGPPSVPTLTGEGLLALLVLLGTGGTLLIHRRS
jgi:hypothetical protein